MSTEYDSITSAHYAAYRPALHETILKKCIAVRNDFSLGLDIGCGTGHSSIALAKFCKKVIGVDPSQPMIENAIGHPQIEYHVLENKTLDFESDRFDLVTFAGSLHYAKSQNLLNEVVRVTKNKGSVLVYDFEILLDKVLYNLGFESFGEETYNHEADFSGLQKDSISLVKNRKETIQIEILVNNLVYLILSVKEQYLFFEKQFGKENLHPRLSERLMALTDSNTFRIGANLYYKVYVIS